MAAVQYLRQLLPALAVILAASAHADEKFALGKRLFLEGATPACAVCHALKDAGSEGAIGPELDEIRPDAARVARALRSGLGVMPSYAATLTEAQIDALAHYVSKASGGAP
ncbi:c-type cytochrome [Caldimonas thermodepolymerans]|uniref:Sulfide dehydrogenase n=1 Tax=Caldimonas thermodepolymerans TaxID=215580 RepID=A0A2S5T6R0_9BURK|nr:cytochrome c [Caldimonas thermodepolymerans]PPE70629.1 sulfide dehydrogenase [Caldimonas thermodepolymerans]